MGQEEYCALKKLMFIETGLSTEVVYMGSTKTYNSTPAPAVWSNTVPEWL